METDRIDTGSDERGDVTRLLEAAGAGDGRAADELLPLLYDELRRFAQKLLANEPAGQTLQATALVHEVYLRLVGPGGDGDEPDFEGRRHFFNAAALAMRRILIERGRRHVRRRDLLDGAPRDRTDDVVVPLAEAYPPEDWGAVDRAISEMAEHEPRWAEVLQLRFCIGLSVTRTAEVLGVSPTTVKSDWRYARAWLRCRVEAITGRSGDAGAR